MLPFDAGSSPICFADYYSLYTIQCIYLETLDIRKVSTEFGKHCLLLSMVPPPPVLVRGTGRDSLLITQGTGGYSKGKEVAVYWSCFLLPLDTTQF